MKEGGEEGRTKNLTPRFFSVEPIFMANRFNCFFCSLSFPLPDFLFRLIWEMLLFSSPFPLFAKLRKWMGQWISLLPSLPDLTVLPPLIINVEHRMNFLPIRSPFPYSPPSERFPELSTCEIFFFARMSRVLHEMSDHYLRTSLRLLPYASAFFPPTSFRAGSGKIAFILHYCRSSSAKPNKG